MTVKNLIAPIFAIAIVLTSCSKEEIPTPNSVTVSPMTNQIDSAVDEKMNPTVVATPSACGEGFNVDITYQGFPIEGAYHYEIREAGTDIVIDAGSISSGDNTNWVLNPCASYDFEFWGNVGCPGCSTIQTLTSDGCNGEFSC